MSVKSTLQRYHGSEIVVSDQEHRMAVTGDMEAPHTSQPTLRYRYLMKSISSELHTRLNQETGRLTWPELERHFARGVLIRVSGELDLVTVAASMAMDDKAAIQQWMTGGLLGRASTNEACRWHETRAEFWAVVTAPWVLVQEIPAEQ